MPRDFLDVLDTAVKVGLGAAIGGLTAYCKSVLQNTHEIKKEKDKEKRSLTISISENLTKSEEFMNEFVIEVRYLLINADDVSNTCIKRLWNILSKVEHLVCVAKSNANLLGSDSLFNELAELSICLGNFLSLAHKLQDKTPDSSELLEAEWKNAISRYKLIYPLITEAYEKI